MSQHGDDGMMRVFLGQRGLTPLCKLLKRGNFVNDQDILILCIKYSYYAAGEHKDLQMSGANPRTLEKRTLKGGARERSTSSESMRL